MANLTNDAWFGRSAAPFQHHLIASFRAIENQRYLVRATNTGLTAVVDPTGRTVAQLPPFSEGTIVEEVRLLTRRTPYSRWPIEEGWLTLGWLAAAAAVIQKLRKRR